MNERRDEFVNRYEADVLSAVVANASDNQRKIALKTKLSLGVVNRSVKSLVGRGFISEDYNLLPSGRDYIYSKTPRNAVILAAGYGMRMIPINYEIPKALIEVNGQRLIERLIGQLHEIGIADITIVVGFLKEQFEYLIDKYGVELVVNTDYSFRNNLYSLNKVIDNISNTYIVPCDVWCRYNPFSSYESYTWYMVTDKKDTKNGIKVNRQMVITGEQKADTNSMLGIAYIDSWDADKLRDKVRFLTDSSVNDGLFWEYALFDCGVQVNARVVSSVDAVEINTYEQLRDFDNASEHIKSEVIDVIARCLGADASEIKNIEILKKGMTNRSFIFACHNRRYIMRIPGEGTDKLIDRHHEAQVYRKISGAGFCDDPVYFDADQGYKITGYLENVRTLDPYNDEDLRKGVKLLKRLHDTRIKVDHEFDLFGQIDYYMSLWGENSSVYSDYPSTYKNVMSLKPFVLKEAGNKCLTHIDAIPDNFLFYKDSERIEKLQLVDWEYSSMQDPHVDLAMFSIYSYYTKTQIDNLIDLYFEGNCSELIRIKIYCYVAICGLLWSNWCEYKRSLGIEFGEYTIKQYRYAKEYFRIACEEAERAGICIK